MDVQGDVANMIDGGIHAGQGVPAPLVFLSSTPDPAA